MIKIVRIFILLILLIIITPVIKAQTDSLNAPYLKYQHLPDFVISTCPDSTLYTNRNLKKNLKTVFIIFSPDCEYCQHETRDLLKNISRFKKTQILMVSFMPQKMINAFYKKYKISSFPIIVMGKDSRYFFLKFFRLRFAPSTFVYDENSNFKKAFHHIVDMDTLLKEL